MTNTGQITNKSRQFWKRVALAFIGVVCAALVASWLGQAFRRIVESNYRVICQENLKQLGAALRMYAKDNDDRYPTSDIRSDLLLLPVELLYPKYLSDLSILICPSDDGARAKLKTTPEAQRDTTAVYSYSSYCYLGYAIEDEKQGLALIDGLKKILLSGAPLPDKIPVCDGCGFEGKDSIPALKEGVKHFSITPEMVGQSGSFRPQLYVCAAFELLGHHEPKGVNVLYLDGHVEFRKLSNAPASFPATPKFLAALEELVKLRQSLPKESPRPLSKTSVVAPQR